MPLAHTYDDPHEHRDWDGADDHDPVLFAFEHADYPGLADALQDGDTYRKTLLPLSDGERLDLTPLLAARGLELVDDDNYWVVCAAPPDSDNDNDQPTEHTGDTPGPVPTVNLDDPTLIECRFCLHLVQGPPEPFCCEERKRHVLKIDAGEHPVFVDPTTPADDPDPKDPK